MESLVLSKKWDCSVLQERYFRRQPRMESDALFLEATGEYHLKLRLLEQKIVRARIRLKEHPYKQLRKARFLAEHGDERFREYWERQVSILENSLL